MNSDSSDSEVNNSEVNNIEDSQNDLSSEIDTSSFESDTGNITPQNLRITNLNRR